MRSRWIIDKSVDSQVVMLDLGEDYQYLDVEIPRYTTWLLSNRRGIAPELIALNQVLNCSVLKPIVEDAKPDVTKTWVKQQIKLEIEKASKSAKKDELTFAKNVLISLFKSLYAKRGAWLSDISGSKGS